MSEKKEKKPTWFRKMGTNQLFAYTRFMEERNDMIPYFGPVPIPTNADAGIPEVDTKAEQIELLIQSISKLKEADFNKGDGKPKITALENMLGMIITSEVRDEAWAKMQGDVE